MVWDTFQFFLRFLFLLTIQYNCMAYSNAPLWCFVFLVCVPVLAGFFAQEAPIQSALGFVPLACTVLLHLYLRRNVIAPLKQLSLEKAANVDIDDGELEAEMLEVSLYAQPCLQDEMEDRQPFPYRREDENSPSVDRMAI